MNNDAAYQVIDLKFEVTAEEENVAGTLRLSGYGVKWLAGSGWNLNCDLT